MAKTTLRYVGKTLNFPNLPPFEQGSEVVIKDFDTFGPQMGYETPEEFVRMGQSIEEQDLATIFVDLIFPNRTRLKDCWMGLLGVTHD